MDTTQEFAVFLADTAYLAGLAAMPMNSSSAPLPEAANDENSEAA